MIASIKQGRQKVAKHGWYLLQNLTKDAVTNHANAFLYMFYLINIVWWGSDQNLMKIYKTLGWNQSCFFLFFQAVLLNTKVLLNMKEEKKEGFLLLLYI